MNFDRMDGNDTLWQTVFADGHPDLQKQHRLHRLLPSDPRCRMCLVPFQSWGGWIMSRRGKSPSSRNPNYCSACDGFLDAFPGGAEIDMSILYVDIRNSVKASEGAAPADVSKRVNGFLSEATSIIVEHDGFIMAFYGDCVVAVWPPGFSGPNHAKKAIAAAKALGAAFGPENEVMAGTGVHTGPTYIGTVDAAKGTFRDISIFGLAVNVTARLASTAKAGQALASEDVARAASIPIKNQEAIKMKGVSKPIVAVPV